MKYLLLSWFIIISHVVSAQQKDIDFQGHRGCRGLMPENSIPAFLHALDLGVTTLEMDVVITQDLQVVVSHDPVLNEKFCRIKECLPIPNGEEKRIYHLSYSRLGEFDTGCNGNPDFPEQQKLSTPIPTLSALIDTVQATIAQKGFKQVWYNIEIKSEPAGDGILHPAPEEFAKLLLEQIETKNIAGYVVIQSFDVRALQAVKKKNATIQTALLVANMKGFNQNIKLLGFRPDIYSPYYKLVGKRMLKKAHEQNIRVIPWTVNELNTMQKLIKLGVDGIISDYPNLFEKL